MAVAAVGVTASTMAAASTAVTVASIAYSTMQARKAAQAQEEARKRKNEQIVEQTIANYGELSAQEQDAQTRALDEAMEVQKDYLVQKGQVTNMAAALGTGGMAIDSQLNDLKRTKYDNYGIILQDRQARMDNISAQAESMKYQAASSMDVTPIKRPSWAAAALNMGAAGLRGYSQYQGLQKESSLLAPATTTSGG